MRGRLLEDPSSDGRPSPVAEWLRQGEGVSIFLPYLGRVIWAKNIIVLDEGINNLEIQFSIIVHTVCSHRILFTVCMHSTQLTLY
jgi:hypothetical protein